MDVIRCNHVIQDARAITLLRLKQPPQPATSVLGEFQKKLFLVATMGNMPKIAGYKVSIGAGHQNNMWLIGVGPQQYAAVI